jgi:hypothetical protein
LQEELGRYRRGDNSRDIIFVSRGCDGYKTKSEKINDNCNLYVNYILNKLFAGAEPEIESKDEVESKTTVGVFSLGGLIEFISSATEKCGIDFYKVHVGDAMYPNSKSITKPEYTETQINPWLNAFALNLKKYLLESELKNLYGFVADQDFPPDFQAWVGEEYDEARSFWAAIYCKIFTVTIDLPGNHEAGAYNFGTPYAEARASINLFQNTVREAQDDIRNLGVAYLSSLLAGGGAGGKSFTAEVDLDVDSREVTIHSVTNDIYRIGFNTDNVLQLDANKILITFNSSLFGDEILLLRRVIEDFASGKESIEILYLLHHPGSPAKVYGLGSSRARHGDKVPRMFNVAKGICGCAEVPPEDDEDDEGVTSGKEGSAVEAEDGANTDKAHVRKVKAEFKKQDTKYFLEQMPFLFQEYLLQQKIDLSNHEAIICALKLFLVQDVVAACTVKVTHIAAHEHAPIAPAVIPGDDETIVIVSGVSNHVPIVRVRVGADSCIETSLYNGAEECRGTALLDQETRRRLTNLGLDSMLLAKPTHLTGASTHTPLLHVNNSPLDYEMLAAAIGSYSLYGKVSLGGDPIQTMQNISSALQSQIAAINRLPLSVLGSDVAYFTLLANLIYCRSLGNVYEYPGEYSPQQKFLANYKHNNGHLGKLAIALLCISIISRQPICNIIPKRFAAALGLITDGSTWAAESDAPVRLLIAVMRSAYREPVPKNKLATEIYEVMSAVPLAIDMLLCWFMTWRSSNEDKETTHLMFSAQSIMALSALLVLNRFIYRTDWANNIRRVGWRNWPKKKRDRVLHILLNLIVSVLHLNNYRFFLSPLSICSWNVLVASYISASFGIDLQWQILMYVLPSVILAVDFVTRTPNITNGLLSALGGKPIHAAHYGYSSCVYKIMNSLRALMVLSFAFGSVFFNYEYFWVGQQNVTDVNLTEVNSNNSALEAAAIITGIDIVSLAFIVSAILAIGKPVGDRVCGDGLYKLAMIVFAMLSVVTHFVGTFFANIQSVEFIYQAIHENVTYDNGTLVVKPAAWNPVTDNGFSIGDLSQFIIMVVGSGILFAGFKLPLRIMQAMFEHGDNLQKSERLMRMQDSQIDGRVVAESEAMYMVVPEGSPADAGSECLGVIKKCANNFFFVSDDNGKSGEVSRGLDL